MNPALFSRPDHRDRSNAFRLRLLLRLLRGTTVSIVAFTTLFAPSLSAAPASPELAAKIDQVFAKWNHPNTPGVIVAVAQNGETIFSRGYGMANLEHAIPLTPDTITESGSVAKQFTAAAVVLLAQRGKLSLEDPVRKHLPELPAALADRITVRMLLNHTSGLRDIHGLFDLMGRPSYTSMHDNAEVLRVVSRQQQLNFVPGTEYLYCNTAFILAAIIVERASGQSFGKFCEEQVFQPRGMTHTSWRTDFAALVPGRASGYEPGPDSSYVIDTPYSNIIGNGGLFFTTGDLLKWNASLDETTGEWGEVVKALQTRSKLNDDRPIDYGLGIAFDDYAGVKEISHGGATSGYKTFLARFPDRGLSLAVLSNAGEFNASATAHSVARLVLDLPPPPRPPRVTVAADALTASAGFYHSAQADDFLTLTVKDGKLFEGTAELIPTAPGTFKNTTGKATFVFAAAPARGFIVTTGNGSITYAPVTSARRPAAELATFAGTYRSDELDVAATLSVKDGHLMVERWPAPPVEAKSIAGDFFSFGPGWHATFTRDDAGAISGCELTNGRCRRVKFVRR